MAEKETAHLQALGLDVACHVLGLTDEAAVRALVQALVQALPPITVLVAPQRNSGDGISLALAVGATLGTGYAHPAFWAPVSILQRPDGSQLRYPHWVWECAKPGLMAVNGAALCQRIDFVPRVRSCHVPLAPGRFRHSRLPGVRLTLHRALVRAGYLYRVDTLGGLAQLLGLEPQALERSVERFSGFAASGEDPDFGKGSNAYNRYLGAADHAPNPCLGPLQLGLFTPSRCIPAISAPQWACAATKMPKCSMPVAGPSQGCMLSATIYIP